MSELQVIIMQTLPHIDIIFNGEIIIELVNQVM